MPSCQPSGWSFFRWVKPRFLGGNSLAEIHILSLLRNHTFKHQKSGRDSFQSFWIYQIPKKSLPRKFISASQKKKSNNANAQGRLALRHQNRSSTSRTRSWKSLSLAPGRGQRGSDLSWSRCRFFGTKMDGLAVKVRLDIYCRFRKLVKNGLFVMVPFIRRQFWWMLLDVVGCYARLFRG